MMHAPRGNNEDLHDQYHLSRSVNASSPSLIPPSASEIADVSRIQSILKLRTIDVNTTNTTSARPKMNFSTAVKGDGAGNSTTSSSSSILFESSSRDDYASLAATAAACGGGARAVYWSSVLGLPNNDTAFKTLNLRKGDEHEANYGKAFADCSDLLKTERQSRCAKRLWLLMTTAEPFLKLLPFVPFLCVAVSRSIPSSPMISVEVMFHILGNIVPQWLSESVALVVPFVSSSARLSSSALSPFPIQQRLPPSQLIVYLDDALRVAEKLIFPAATVAGEKDRRSGAASPRRSSPDVSLWEHLNFTCGASANDYFWLPLQTFFMYGFIEKKNKKSSVAGAEGSAAEASEKAWHTLFDAIVVPRVGRAEAAGGGSIKSGADGFTAKEMFGLPSSYQYLNHQETDGYGHSDHSSSSSPSSLAATAMASASQRTLYAIAVAVVLMKRRALLACASREEVHNVMTSSIFEDATLSSSPSSPSSANSHIGPRCQKANFTAHVNAVMEKLRTTAIRIGGSEVFGHASFIAFMELTTVVVADADADNHHAHQHRFHTPSPLYSPSSPDSHHYSLLLKQHHNGGVVVGGGEGGGGNVGFGALSDHQRAYPPNNQMLPRSVNMNAVNTKYATLEAIEESEREMFRAMKNELETLEMMRGVKSYFYQHDHDHDHDHDNHNAAGNVNNPSTTMTNAKLMSEYEALKARVAVNAGYAPTAAAAATPSSQPHSFVYPPQHLRNGFKGKSEPSSVEVPPAPPHFYTASNDEPTIGNLSRIPHQQHTSNTNMTGGGAHRTRSSDGGDAEDGVDGPTAVAPTNNNLNNKASSSAPPTAANNATTTTSDANRSQVIPDSIIEAVSLLMRAQQRRERKTQPHEMHQHYNQNGYGNRADSIPSITLDTVHHHNQQHQRQEPSPLNQPTATTVTTAAVPISPMGGVPPTASAPPTVPLQYQNHHHPVADAAGVVNSRTASGTYTTASAPQFNGFHSGINSATLTHEHEEEERHEEEHQRGDGHHHHHQHDPYRQDYDYDGRRTPMDERAAVVVKAGGMAAAVSAAGGAAIPPLSSSSHFQSPAQQSSPQSAFVSPARRSTVPPPPPPPPFAANPMLPPPHPHTIQARTQPHAATVSATAAYYKVSSSATTVRQTSVGATTANTSASGGGASSSLGPRSAPSHYSSQQSTANGSSTQVNGIKGILKK